MLIKKSILVFFCMASSFLSVAQEEYKTYWVFGTAHALLGTGDYTGVMNEFGVHKYIRKYSGVDFSLNYVMSGKAETIQDRNVYSRNHIVNLAYLRMNYFIEPVNVRRLSFNISGGFLFGYAGFSALNNVRQYQTLWRPGYNIKLNMNYQISRKIGCMANAGFDILGEGDHTNAYLGMSIYRKLNSSN